MKSGKKKGILSKREILACGLATLGINTGSLLATSFMSVYWTDIAGIPIAAVSIIYLFSKIFDGITDIIMGFLIDKCHLKGGKAKPWIFIGGVAQAILTIFMFNVPKISTRGMIIYAAFTYVVFQAIFNTMSGVSSNTMILLMSDQPADRAAAGASANTGLCIHTLLLAMVSLPFVSALGGGQTGWRIYTIILGVLDIVFLLIYLTNTKERFAKTEETDGKIEIRSALKALFHNKYFICSTMMGLMLNLMIGLTNGIGVYYSTQILGNESYYSIITMATIPAYLLLPLSVPLMSKFGKTNVVIAGIVVSILGTVPMMIVPTNIIAICIASIMRSAGYMPLMAGLAVFISEACDYGTWKSGIPIQGLAFCGTSFGSKVGAGFGAAINGIIMAVAGYNGLAAVQSTSAINAIKFLQIFSPVVPLVVIIIFTAPFKKLEGMQDQIRADLYGE